MRILLLETIHDEAVELLGQIGEVHLIADLSPERVIDECSTSHAVITRGRGRIPRPALASGSRLKCVARCGAGTDNIDVAAATELGLPVIFSPDGTTYSVAEHALMLMMAVGRRLAFLDREVKRGNWEVRSRIGINSELYGKRMGILGLGRIGRRTAELGAAFGCEIIYWSANTRDERFRYVELDELFRTADIISVSLALAPETRGVVDAHLIGLMKPSAIIVNTGRGEMMDEAALASALEEKRIAGAGFDVMAEEPPPADHPLFGFDNVVITPHVATITDVAYRKMCVDVARQVARVLAGGEPAPESVRNPQVLPLGRPVETT
ncbi:MAG: hydroxyacid dehydrogenase [Acidobacteria bacterium]|nr:hydroxyacid dehydrogenase [Acidobacteriota bacterium]MCW5968112.1 hydroxyacid dehydrogenase [Blastocatellales bacterium]